ncbi:hypothetical protein, partial [Bacteroides heparinolyticus]|uniref:hypothetical protein n=1 Tax=Prevotella heparinolytica TaxID=28113 RepID=UPI0035A18699
CNLSTRLLSGWQYQDIRDRAIGQDTNNRFHRPGQTAYSRSTLHIIFDHEVGYREWSDWLFPITEDILLILE